MEAKQQSTRIPNSTSAAKPNTSSNTVPNATEGFTIPFDSIPGRTVRRPQTTAEVTLGEFGMMLREYSMLCKWGHRVELKAPHTRYPYLTLANLTIYLDAFSPENEPPKFEILIDDITLPVQFTASQALDFINNLTARNKKRYGR